jgi:trimethylamine--corrinoid protein Co-methyltransferase
MPEQPVIHPRLTLLNSEQKDEIHHYALRIVEKTGVRVDSKPVKDFLIQKLGAAAAQEDIVRIPADVVVWALKQAPQAIDVYNRGGELAFRLGADRHRFGLGVTSLFYQDSDTDGIVPFARRHMQEIVRLGDSLPLYDVISTIGIIQDVPPTASDLVASLEMVANTTKPLVFLISDENRFSNVLDMLEHLHGDLAEKPFIIPYFNPVTPLVMNEGTLDKMRVAIQRGIPFIISNYSLAGMSTPITPAGTLVIMLAELLAGLTITQLIKPGAPVILGILPAYFDMKTMVNFYDPQSMVLNLACAEMMAYYQLPHCGTSGSGTGWGPDLLSMETYWMNHMTACLTKGGLSPFVGDTLTSKAFSAANTVYVHEIIRQALMYAEGFALSEESACLSEIEQVGPGGHFLDSPTTLKSYRSAYYTSPIHPRYSMEQWVDKGQPKAIDLLREYTRQLLRDLKAPEDHDELIQKGEAFIDKLDFRK